MSHLSLCTMMRLVMIFACAASACAGNTKPALNDELPRDDAPRPFPKPPPGPAYPTSFDALQALIDDDLAIQRRGKGWHCFIVAGETAKVSVCRRTSDDCEDFRRAYFDSKMSITSCQDHSQAFCLRFKERSKGYDRAKCSVSAEECESDQQWYRRDTKFEFVSDCERLL